MEKFPYDAPAEVFVIAVPTPFEKDGNHTPDVSYVIAAATSLAAVLKKGDCVILESTSPVGTTEQVARLLAELRQETDYCRHHRQKVLAFFAAMREQT